MTVGLLVPGWDEGSREADKVNLPETLVQTIPNRANSLRQLCK